MSQTIAVDVVVLPPREVAEKIIAINRRAAARDRSWGLLGIDDFLPHLSLAMGGVRDDDLKVVEETIRRIVSQFHAIPIELNELYFAEKPNGEKVYAIRAKNSPELQRLHEEMMSALGPYLSYDCTKESLCFKPGETISEPGYINEFLSKYSFDAFDPHITTRTKEAEGSEDLPIHFTATTIAACHVGPMTTCRKVLFSAEMVD